MLEWYAVFINYESKGSDNPYEQGFIHLASFYFPDNTPSVRSLSRLDAITAL